MILAAIAVAIVCAAVGPWFGMTDREPIGIALLVLSLLISGAVALCA